MLILDIEKPLINNPLFGIMLKTYMKGHYSDIATVVPRPRTHNDEATHAAN